MSTRESRQADHAMRLLREAIFTLGQAVTAFDNYEAGHNAADSIAPVRQKLLTIFGKITDGEL